MIWHNYTRTYIRTIYRPLLLRIANNNSYHVPAEIIGNLVDLRADVRSAGKITTM